MFFCALTAVVYRIHWKVGTCYALTLVSSLQSFQMSVVVHNCAHTHPFTSPSANFVFFLILTLLSGSPTSLYVPGHNESHHRHLEKKGDMMRTNRMQYKSDTLNFVLFIPTILPDVIKNEQMFMKEQWRKGSSLFRQYLCEMSTFYAFLFLLFANDWRKTVIVYVIPSLIGKAFILSLNMLQHYRCEPDSKYNHSRNFTGPILNFLFLCNGYHTVHHISPGLHWSLLPREHSKIAHHINPLLIHSNILMYTLKTHGPHKLWST